MGNGRISVEKLRYICCIVQGFPGLSGQRKIIFDPFSSAKALFSTTANMTEATHPRPMQA